MGKVEESLNETVGLESTASDAVAGPLVDEGCFEVALVGEPSASIIASAGSVTVGAVVSLAVMVCCVEVAELPDASIADHVLVMTSAILVVVLGVGKTHCNTSLKPSRLPGSLALMPRSLWTTRIFSSGQPRPAARLASPFWTR